MFIASVTNDGKYLMIYTTKDTDNVQLLHIADISKGLDQGAKDLNLEIKAVIPEWIGGFSYIHNKGSAFYFNTNFLSPMGRVIMIDVDKPQQDNWIEVIPEHEKNVLEGSFCSNGLIVNSYLENAHTKIKIYSIGGQNESATYIRDLELPDLGSVGGVSGYHDSDELFYSFSSFTDPGSQYKVNMTTFEQEQIRKTKLHSSCPNPSDFVTD